ncbi:MAG TPA: LysR substrate-binding domain-containing protein, partial [Burkholderiales bacterium]|nr:LysR substrate-binding domain-containing protein [Burkholderiales bacterium]
HGRGVRLTDSGKRLLAHGKGILHQVELARQELEGQHASPVGRVIVGLPPSLCKRVAVPLVSTFRKRFPQASIGIVEGMTVSMQEWLTLGRLDCALLYDPPAMTPLEYTHLWSEDLCLVSRTRGAKLPPTVRLKDLARYPLIVPSRPNAVRNLIETEAAAQGISLDVTLEIDAIASVVDLVARGYGYAILSRIALESWAKNGTLRATPIVRPAITSRVVLATSRERPLTALAQGTLDLIHTDIVPDARRIVRARE